MDKPRGLPTPSSTGEGAASLYQFLKIMRTWSSKGLDPSDVRAKAIAIVKEAIPELKSSGK